MRDGPTATTYFFLKTEDGSPTLRFNAEPIDAEGRKSETMHSFRGAFSETAYIYGAAVEEILKSRVAPRFFSLGLGLGYNELLTTALILKSVAAGEMNGYASINLSTVYGESFEAIAELNDLFSDWVHGEAVRADFQTAYDEILAACARHTQINADEIRAQFARWLDSGQWHLRPALADDTTFNRDFTCFFFDAFSSKTSPELWGEEFLNRLFARLTAPQAVLATYACTGALKRSLKANGFNLFIREGFASKRDSTFALKGFP